MIVSFATAVLLAQGTVLAAEPEAHPVDLAALETCGDSLDVAIFNSPRYPWSGAPMRVLIVSDRDLGAARVVALAPDGQQREIAAAPYGGPPWGWIAEVPEPDTGTWRFALQSATGLQACQEVVVRRGRFGSDAGEPGEPVWQDRIKWERDTENLYSLWIERLFQAPLEEEVSWNPLAEVLRDPERNLLYGYMGLDEDRDGMKLNPDCADFPYFMRGYFAWKLGLPFTFRPCRRGNAVRAPTCSVNYQSNLEPSEDATRTGAFKSFMRTVKATVHSSSLRSLPEDERSDYYPVALTRRGLRPGTIYTDPYGHTMMISRWYPQEGDRAGVLMAVDAQPDGVIGRRVFWRGSFMFPEDDKLAGAGWKRFRPVRRKGSETVPMTNEEINASVDYGDYSVEQWAAGKDGFYERMDALISPRPLAPERALVAVLDALEQQVRRRVESIDMGEGWVRDNAGKTMPMPDGGAIFITSGPWEDFSTPSRDMRLLIAMDTVADFPARVERRPDRFVLAPGADLAVVRAELKDELRAEAGRRSFEYTRSDGSKWKLTLADVLDRAVAMEMAYNPNDCVELRWGAPEGSEERATCQRHAPEAQRAKMREYRTWFSKRERPIH